MIASVSKIRLSYTAGHPDPTARLTHDIYLSSLLTDFSDSLLDIVSHTSLSSSAAA